MLRLIRRAFLVGAITLALCLAVDLTAGQFIGRLHRPMPDLSAIPAFRDQPYASAEFAAEYTEIQPFDTVPGTNLLWPALRRGQFYNIDKLPPTNAHYRLTANPPDPKAPVRVVLFLGGSLIFGPGVPDDSTVPSILSRRLNADDRDHGYIVLNAGVEGAVSAQELGRLQYELAHGLRPDIVVAFEGANELMQGIYLGVPGSRAVSGRSRLGELIHDYLPLHIYRWLRFKLADLATSRGERRAPAHLADETQVSALTRATVALYTENVLAMARLAAANGARFIVVLNPTSNSTDYVHPTPDLAFVSEASARAHPGASELMRRIWPALAAASSDLRHQGIEALDLSDLFRDKTADVFIEASHFNATGHEMLAARVADAILQGVASR